MHTLNSNICSQGLESLTMTHIQLYPSPDEEKINRDQQIQAEWSTRNMSPFSDQISQQVCHAEYQEAIILTHFTAQYN